MAAISGNPEPPRFLVMVLKRKVAGWQIYTRPRMRSAFLSDSCAVDRL